MILTYKEKTYQKSKARWHDTAVSMSGIMGGFAEVSDIDTSDSCLLLEKLIAEKLINPGTVLDCAAGIGRVSQHVLTKYFQQIDIVEQDEKFTNHCKKIFAQNHKVRNIYCDSLQNFEFSNSYDAIWIQWCLQDLIADDVVTFLINCKKHLQENGVIIIKENIASEKLIDENLGFEIRTLTDFSSFFSDCQLKLITQQTTANWPTTLLPTISFALKAY